MSCVGSTVVTDLLKIHILLKKLLQWWLPYSRIIIRSRNCYEYVCRYAFRASQYEELEPRHELVISIIRVITWPES